MRHALRNCLLLFACLVTVSCRNEEALQSGSSESYYRTNLDNQGRSLANQVEETLREAGVCSLPVHKGYYGGRYIDSKDDVFTHFMLLANVESVLGSPEGLDGVGGAGMFGTNLRHFDTNVKGTNPQNGQVFYCRKGMTDEQIRRDHISNAKCAFALYLRSSGFGPWGPDGGDWGSNRKIGDLSPTLISQLSRKCGFPACDKATIKWTGKPSVLPESPGAQSNVVSVSIPAECPAKKIAVKLFTSSKGEKPSSEWIEEVPRGSAQATVDLVHLKRRTPNIVYKFLRIQLKQGNDVLATLPLSQLPLSHD